MFENYTDVRDWLENFIPNVYGKEELGLSRIEELLRRLGNPQEKFKSIHVAGTSGKGSTAFYIARLLEYSSQRLETRDQKNKGLVTGPWQLVSPKIGLHVSPHLVDIRERMQINGELIPMDRFIRVIGEIREVVEQIQREKPELTPSYFEILVAASFLYFAKERVDWAVVEVGLGGRLDATNVLQSRIAVITNVGLDHTEILGDTLEKIAEEKAGIIKGKEGYEGKEGAEGVPVITAARGTALEVIRRVAREKKAPLVQITNNQYQMTNAKYYHTKETEQLAIKTVEMLGFKVTKEQIEKAFSVGFPGRFEKIQPGVILDGAHNPDKIRALIEWIGNQRPETRDQRPVILVVAFKKGKNWKRMIDLLVGNLPVKEIITTEFQAVTDTGMFAAVPSAEVAAYVMSIVDGRLTIVKTIRNSQEAAWEGLETGFQRPETSLVLVTGSLYLVGEVRAMWD